MDGPPGARSFKSELKAPSSTSRNTADDENPSTALLEFLETPSNLSAFTRHLEKEYSQENIEFYLAVQQYRSCTGTMAELKAMGLQIVDVYIKSTSMSQVNVDSVARSKVENAFQDETTFANIETAKTVFDSCYQEILALMAKDSFHRFKKTKEYSGERDGALLPSMDEADLVGGEPRKSVIVKKVPAVASRRPGPTFSLFLLLLLLFVLFLCGLYEVRCADCLWIPWIHQSFNDLFRRGVCCVPLRTSY